MKLFKIIPTTLVLFANSLLSFEQISETSGKSESM